MAQTLSDPYTAILSPISCMTATDVDLWQSSLRDVQVDVARCERLLDVGEQARARRYVHELTRMRFVVARARLRILLGRYLEIDPRTVRLTCGKNGKPCLDRVHSTDLRFNVSHADDLVLYAVARGREVGVDVERVRDDLPVMGIAMRFFTPEEIEAFRALPAPARVEAFFVCWTRKEAYLKATGEGLGFGLDRFAVGIAGEARGTLSGRDPDNGTDCWSIESLSLSPGYTGAVVAEGTDWKLLRYDMTSAFSDVSRTENFLPKTSAGAR